MSFSETEVELIQELSKVQLEGSQGSLKLGCRKQVLSWVPDREELASVSLRTRPLPVDSLFPLPAVA